MVRGDISGRTDLFPLFFLTSAVLFAEVLDKYGAFCGRAAFFFPIHRYALDFMRKSQYFKIFSQNNSKIFV